MVVLTRETKSAEEPLCQFEPRKIKMIKKAEASLQRNANLTTKDTKISRLSMTDPLDDYEKSRR